MEMVSYFVGRVLHVLGAGLLFGGASVVWAAFRIDDTVSVRLLSWFELAFWGVLAMIVFTGLGNLATVGVPPLETRRGQALASKLLVLLGLVLCSTVRSSTIVRLERRDAAATSNRRLARLYAMTSLGFAILIVAAGVLVRG